MKYLIVTNCHGEFGKVLELMDSKKHSFLQDDKQRLFSRSDAVSLDDLTYQLSLAKAQLKYWGDVYNTIFIYMKEEADESI